MSAHERLDDKHRGATVATHEARRCGGAWSAITEAQWDPHPGSPSARSGSRECPVRCHLGPVWQRQLLSELRRPQDALNLPSIVVTMPALQW